jgi:hypothetical protein
LQLDKHITSSSTSSLKLLFSRLALLLASLLPAIYIDSYKLATSELLAVALNLKVISPLFPTRSTSPLSHKRVKQLLLKTTTLCAYDLSSHTYKLTKNVEYYTRQPWRHPPPTSPSHQHPISW